jgi:hypothetical protein
MSGPCSVCGDITEYCCSDCKIDKGVDVYVCTKPACRDAHDKVCSHPSDITIE